jgi:hypothetical protein
VLGLSGPGLATLTLEGGEAALPAHGCAAPEPTSTPTPTPTTTPTTTPSAAATTPAPQTTGKAVEAPARITAKAAKARITAGQKPKVTVRAATGKLSGTVTVSWGKGARATTVTASGKASVVVSGPRLPVGKRTVTATYRGSTGGAALTAKTSLTVTKAKATVTVKSTARSVIVRVKASGIAPVTGRVTVKAGGASVTARLAGGKATVKRSAFGPAAVKATVTYKGSARVAKKTVRKALKRLA